MSHQSETERKTQDTLQGLWLSAGLGTPWVPLNELEEVTGPEVCLRLTPDNAVEE